MSVPSPAKIQKSTRDYKYYNHSTEEKLNKSRYQEISTAKKTEGTPQGGRCRVGHRGFPKLLGVHHQGVRLSQGPGEKLPGWGPEDSVQSPYK